MRFDPKADISTGNVSEGGGSARTRLPMPASMGGGRAGLIVMVLGLLVRFFLSRRRTAATTR
jgi:hypothetical protein